MIKQTPLYDIHKELGGQMVDFAGYSLPVQYQKGIIAEHNTVRNAVGLFDVSHMGEFLVRGTDAVSALNAVLTNDISTMKIGQCRYTLICNDAGGIVDDILVYRFDECEFFLVVNASNTQKDFEWLSGRLSGDVELIDVSEKIALIAIQGPKSADVLAKLSNISLKYFTFQRDAEVASVNCLVSRTGYTGEDGFEIYIKVSDAKAVFSALCKAGEDFGIECCGLGARDTLRLEASLPLYGHELAEDILASEVGLEFAIKYQKDSFVGKESLLSKPQVYTRLGATLSGGIAREGAKVFCSEELVGYVTSGTFSPTLKKAICMLRVKKQFEKEKLTVEIRGRRLDLDLVDLPFYKRI